MKIVVVYGNFATTTKGDIWKYTYKEEVVNEWKQRKIYITNGGKR